MRLSSTVALLGAFVAPKASSFTPPSIKTNGRAYCCKNLICRQNHAVRPPPNDTIGIVPTRSHRNAGPLTMAALLGPTWPAIQSSLLTAPYLKALVSLAAVASAVVVPLTLYRQAYSFSVGYGFSIATMNAVLLSAFSVHFFDLSSTAAILASLGVVYGLRLGAFLLVREFTVPSKREQVKEFDKASLPNRVPFAVSVAGFYAMLTSPVLSALRQTATVGSSWGRVIQWAGTGIAALGLLVESAADHHKYLVKMQDSSDGFAGPTGGLFALCRHPNYLGEIIFWLGLYIGGLPTFGRSLIAWVPATLGLYGIVSIMTKATERLDKKQADKYGDEAAYRTWRDDTKAALVPFMNG